MTYSEPLISQINYFLLSLGFGVLIDIWYILVMFIRKCISEKRSAVAIGDVIFGVTVSVASFFFMVLYNNGQVRLNLIAGQFVSAVVLHFVLGSKVLKFLNTPASVSRRMFCFFCIPVKTYLRLLTLSVERMKKAKADKKTETNKKEIKKLKKFNIITKIYLKNKNKSV